MRGAVRPVAVTGLGVVSSAGVGAQAFWEGLLREPEQTPTRPVDFDPAPWFGRKDARHTDRFAQFAVAAADLALADGGLDPADVDPDRAGVHCATGMGGLATFETAVLTGHERGDSRVSPFSVPMIMPNAGAAAVSLRTGWRGPCETVTTACAAGTHGVAAGARLVAQGSCEVVLAGGADASLVRTTLAGFGNAGALSRSGTSRPFDAGRDGFVPGEGAAMLLLEPLEAALARGARVYALVLGAASTADAHHITAPAPGGRGALACMRLALEDAGVEPAEVVHVNAHGTSTPLNDAAEATAVAALLGERAVPVTSVKGVTGHALGAAGAIEAAAVCLSLAHGLVPPTAGHVAGDEVTSRLDVVAGEPRPLRPGPVLSNSFGFGGHNGTLVLGPA